MTSGKTAILFLAISWACSTLGCSKEPDRWESAQKTAEQQADKKPSLADGAAPPAAIEGKKLNAFFPPDEFDGKKRTFTVEKDGFVEATLKDDKGTELAKLAITDSSATHEDAKSKYAAATEKVQTWPLTTTGKNKSSILVADRYQISIMSQKLTAEERKPLFDRFDLSGLAALK